MVSKLYVLISLKCTKCVTKMWVSIWTSSVSKRWNFYLQYFIIIVTLCLLLVSRNIDVKNRAKETLGIYEKSVKFNTYLFLQFWQDLFPKGVFIQSNILQHIDFLFDNIIRNCIIRFKPCKNISFLNQVIW